MLGRMRHSLLFIAVIVLLTGCKLNWKDFTTESDRAFESYLTGDANAAKSALLEQERIIAKHEAAGNRDVNYRQARLILYARLCAVTSHIGQTNEAQEYFRKAMAHRDLTNAVTMTELIASIERSDRETKPKWRQQR